MTDTLLREIGHALYGRSARAWQGEMADALGVNLRSVQRWAVGEGEPPEGVWDELSGLLKHQIKRLDRLDDLALQKIPADGALNR